MKERLTILIFFGVFLVSTVATFGGGGVIGCGGSSDPLLTEEQPTAPDDEGAGGGDEQPEPVCTTYFSMELDPNFGVDGKVALDFDTKTDLGYSLVVQPDGKIVMAGYANWSAVHAHDADLVVVRLDADGSLDTTFDTDGIVTIDCDSFWGVQWWPQQGLALQSDGKILVGGDCGKQAAVYRLNSDGSLDAGFDGDSRADIAPDIAGGQWSAVFSLAMQPDGAGGEQIIVGGIANTVADWDVAPAWILARFDLDGSLDAAFGDQPGNPGIVIEDWGATYNDGIRDLIILDDREIIAFGNTNKGAVPTQNFAVARYDADGVLDATFGDAGLTVVDFGGDDWSYPIALAPDGKLVGGAVINCCGDTLDTGIFRLTADGALDDSFGDAGQVTIDMGGGFKDLGNGIVVLPDGSIIVGGCAKDGTADEDSQDFSFAMLDAGGELSSRFGTDGLLRTDFFGDADAIGNIAFTSLVTDAEGALESFELIAVGNTVQPPRDDSDFAAAHYISVPIEICE